MVSPALEKLACDLADQVKVVNVNVDETPRLQARFTVEAVPTLMLLRGTRILAYRAGAPPEPSLRAWLARALGESKSHAGRRSHAADELRSVGPSRTCDVG